LFHGLSGAPSTAASAERLTLIRLLFPATPRRLPAQRLLGVGLRTAHILAFGILLGGHLFDVDRARLEPYLVAAIATGACMMGLELASTCAWLFMGKGIAVIVKLLLLALVPFFWAQRVPILVLVVIVASVGAHMPSRFRHYSVLAHRVIEPDRCAAP
jgi:hypothetical protein